MGLSKRLLLLAAVVLLPGFAVVSYNELSLRRDRAVQINNDALLETKQAIAEIRRVIEALQGVIVAVSDSPLFEQADVAACNAYLAKVQQHLAYISTVGYIDLNGKLGCNSNSFPAIDLSDRPYFQNALRVDSFIVGEYTKGRLSNKNQLPIALALRGSDRQVRGVAFAALDLEWLRERIAERGMETGASLTIADRDGVIIARDPYPERFVGTRIPEQFMSLVQGDTQGTMELTSQDGTVRILGYVPPKLSGIGLYVSSGLAVDEAFALINRTTRTTLLLSFATMGVSLAFAWLVGTRFIRRPVAAILKTVADWEGGNARSRTRLEPAIGELGQIGAALDHLMDELSRRQAERDDAEKRRDLIAQEMGHRLKNALAIVQAIAYQSFRRLPGGDVEGRVFADRLNALAQAYSIITAANFAASDIETILRSVVRPFDPRCDRFALLGERAPLDAKATLGLTLVGHELCTNAVKYGSLSVPEGRVTICWTHNSDGWISIEWMESGGPAPERPVQVGFGSKLIDGAFSAEYKATVRRRFEPSGLVVTIDFLGSAEPQEKKAAA